MTTPGMSEAEKIAGKLTRKGRAALPYFTEEWAAGPELPDNVLDEISDLRTKQVIEREFGDMSPPSISTDSDSLTIGMSACWWFRLTPLGLEIRAILQRFPTTESRGT